MAYMEKHFDKRLNPNLLVDDAKSVVSLLLNYYPSETQIEDTYKVSKYAYGQDYHFVIKEKIKELLHSIQENIGEVSGRAFVDSAPVLDKAWGSKKWFGLDRKKQQPYYQNNRLILFYSRAHHRLRIRL